MKFQIEDKEKYAPIKKRFKYNIKMYTQPVGYNNIIYRYL